MSKRRVNLGEMGERQKRHRTKRKPEPSAVAVGGRTEVEAVMAKSISGCIC